MDESLRTGRRDTRQHIRFHTGSVGVRGSSPLSSTTKSQVRAFQAVSRQHSRQHRAYSAWMATVRLRTRKDRSAYTAVLFRLDGKQSLMSFDDHAKAVRFEDLVNQVGAAKALEVITAAERTRPQPDGRGVDTPPCGSPHVRRVGDDSAVSLIPGE